MTEGTLRHKTIYASIWSILSHGFGRTLGFIRALIIARLLFPEDIGLFALTTLTLAIVEMLTKTGFKAALIHQKEDIQYALNVAWTVHIIRGIFRAAILVLIAPTVAHFLNEDALQDLIQLIAFAALCEGFTNAGVVYLQKNLVFHKYMLYTWSGMLVDLVVAVSAVLYLGDVRALVYGLIAGRFVQMALSYAVHPFRPHICIDRSVFRHLFRYGIWMNATGVMMFISGHGSSMVVGKVIGTYALGLYQMAIWMTQAVLPEVAIALGLVAFPAYAQLQEDSIRLRLAFLRTTGYTLGLVLPVTVGILFFGPSFVAIFFGETWLAMTDTLRLLAVAGGLQAVALTGSPVFKACGRPRSVFYMYTVQAVVLLILLYPLASAYGIEGAASAMIGSGLSMVVYWFIQIRNDLELSVRDVYQLFSPTLISTALMGGALMILLDLMPASSMNFLAYIWFFGCVTVAFAIYLFSLYLIQPLFPHNQPLHALITFWSNQRKTPLSQLDGCNK